MNELSPKARALIQASRRALRPTAADRERNEVALRARLEGIAPTASSSHVKARWQIIAGSAVGVCVIGIVAFRALQAEPSQPARIIRNQRASHEVAAQDTSASEPTPQPEAAAIELTPAPKAAPRVSARDHLALELELLSRATVSLRTGNASAALKALEEHQRRFPNGTLRQERSIAKAQALCSLGRVQEGKAQLEHVPADTAAATRARQRCEH